MKIRLFLLALTSLILAPGIPWQANGVFAQQATAPTVRFESSFTVPTPPSNAPVVAELVQQILDFPVNGATREHSHGGDAFVTIVEGNVIRRVGDIETNYMPAGTFIEAQGVIHAVRNVGERRARAFASFILAPGAQQTINTPDSPVPAVVAAASFLTRGTILVPAGRFAVVQQVLDFAPNAVLPPQSRGPGIVMVLEGELMFGLGESAARRAPGGIFEGDVAQGGIRNAGVGPAVAVATYLVPQDATSSAAIAQVPASLPATRPPNAGDAGLAAGLPRSRPWYLVVTLILGLTGVVVTLFRRAIR
jgi:quercetin dioxygenase-like cupin family protein